MMSTMKRADLVGFKKRHLGLSGVQGLLRKTRDQIQPKFLGYLTAHRLGSTNGAHAEMS
jgi:hypothetical protein